MAMLFRNRADAGQALAAQLAKYANQADILVLGLPRGGVPVAFQIARALNAPLDVFVSRKLGVPGNDELAMGAIAENGARVLNQDVIRAHQVSPEMIETVAAEERRELARRALLYREGRSLPALDGKRIILVDDGVATGATMLSALRALRELLAAYIIVAVPVAATESTEALIRESQEVVCLHTPAQFHGVGFWYQRFDQTSDEEVRQKLARAVHFGKRASFAEHG